MYYSEDEDDDIVEDEADGEDSDSSRVEACSHLTVSTIHSVSYTAHWLQPHWAKPGSAERINFTNIHSWKQNFNI